MARNYPVGGGAPGIDPTPLTATAGDVVAGLTAGVKDNYDPVVGTLTLTGNAAQNHVLANETYYTNNPKVRLTGTMTVQSILSFSCAPYSASQIIFTWQNPSMGPFSGVIIVGKTGGYPTSISDGTRYYQGFGNNTGALGASSVIVGGFGVNVTYYFYAFSYSLINNQEWIGATTRAGNAIITQTIQTITASTIWTIPSNVNSVEIFCVGGGGGGAYGGGNVSNGAYGGGGGGGGYTSYTTLTNITDRNLNIVIGGGGGPWQNGGSTYVSNAGATIITAQGGMRGGDWTTHREIGGKGGCGGGGGCYAEMSINYGANAGNGGTNGSNGGNAVDPQSGSVVASGGTGQGTSTSAFGNGTSYSGGGGGGGSGQTDNSNRGFGGYYGGGNGASAFIGGSNGTPNSGGGGGGDFPWGGSEDYDPYSGGSGICLIRYIG